MSVVRLTHARADLCIAGVFVVLAVLVIREGIRLGPGWGDSGPDPGFFPFSLAVLMLLGGAAILVRGLVPATRGSESEPFFEHRDETSELLRVGLPIAVAIATVPVLGLYLMAAFYTWMFAWWHGRFRWHTSLAAGIILPVVIYLVLREGFRIPMPYSIWYGSYLPF
jgi:hypothetical protein